jgi:hypothetical protein
MILPFADLGLTGVLVDLLAVAGGAATGGLGAGWGGQRLSRITIRRQLPRPVLQGLRVGGGALSGFLVWLFVFGIGGFGLGTGGFGVGNPGGGVETSAPTSAAEAANTLPTAPETSREAIASREKPLPSAPSGVVKPPMKEMVRIELLGGERYRGDDRWYKVDGGAPQKLGEVLAKLGALQQRDPKFKMVEILLYENGSVAEAHPAVGRLKEGLENLKLAYQTQFLTEEAP